MTITQTQIEPSTTSSSAKLCVVYANDLEPIWEEIKPHLKSALSYSDDKYSLEDIREGIEGKEMQLFIVVKEDILATVVTSIYEYPNSKVMTVVLTGGEKMDKWIHLIEQLERWAKDEGCDYMEILGRPGWERVLKWEKKAVLLKKNIKEELH